MLVYLQLPCRKCQDIMYRHRHLLCQKLTGGIIVLMHDRSELAEYSALASLEPAFPLPCVLVANSAERQRFS